MFCDASMNLLAHWLSSRGALLKTTGQDLYPCTWNYLQGTESTSYPVLAPAGAFLYLLLVAHLDFPQSHH